MSEPFQVHMEVLRFGARAQVKIDIVYPSTEAAEIGLQQFINAIVAMQGSVSIVNQQEPAG